MENFIFCAVSATIITSVGRKRTVFPVKLKLQGESFEQTYQKKKIKKMSEIRDGEDSGNGPGWK